MSADAIIKNEKLDELVTVTVECYTCGKSLLDRPARHECPSPRSSVRLAIEWSPNVDLDW